MALKPSVLGWLKRWFEQRSGVTNGITLAKRRLVRQSPLAVQACKAS